MSPEPAIILLPALGWTLWSAGGTWHKGWRRYGYPLAIVICLSWLDVRVVWTALTTSAVAHLGYGDGKSWLWRGVVGALLGATLLPLHASWVAIGLVAGVFLGTFILSRRFNAVSWKYCEGATGLVHALAVVWTVTH